MPKNRFNVIFFKSAQAHQVKIEIIEIINTDPKPIFTFKIRIMR